MITAKELIIGKIYVCKHSRKGEFSARVDKIRGEWVDCTVMFGSARFVSVENRLIGAGQPGTCITVRDSHCYWQEQADR